MRVSKSDEGASMTDTNAAIARHCWQIMRRVGGPLEHHETKESWDAKVARIAGVLPRRVRAYREGRVKQIGAPEYEHLKRIDAEHRRRALEAKRQQVAALEAQYRHDRDALKERLHELAGPYLELFEKLGVLEKGTARVEEDGEA